MIFTWRILAKSVLHTILPPTFRLLAQAFTLPNRRFYTPATDYKSVPPEKGLHPIPSVIDLPSHMGVDATGMSLVGNNPYRMLKSRNGVGKGRNAELEKYIDAGAEGGAEPESDAVKHYDADGEQLLGLF